MLLNVCQISSEVFPPPSLDDLANLRLSNSLSNYINDHIYISKMIAGSIRISQASIRYQ